ncbi:hypothetical protein IGI04_002653 [Brassica rapa subsp. trilocularis]|uniref:Uncharacterized protein n=1 Tax=Brassica rapa subsp. trilocularis TaxID=1813537 RepID=A0ABQ7NY99_BRACM|nr:hypothetical protein IGI04_002653 [Brassica rapa subsp. trilocularis]
MTMQFLFASPSSSLQGEQSILLTSHQELSHRRSSSPSQNPSDSPRREEKSYQCGGSLARRRAYCAPPFCTGQVGSGVSPVCVCSGEGFRVVAVTAVLFVCGFWFCSQGGPSMTLPWVLPVIAPASSLSVDAAHVVVCVVALCYDVLRFSELGRGGLLGSPLGHWSEDSPREARVRKIDSKMWLSPLPLSAGGLWTEALGARVLSSGGCSRLGLQRLGLQSCAGLESIIWSSAAGKPISTKAWSHVLSKTSKSCGNASRSSFCSSLTRKPFV